MILPGQTLGMIGGGQLGRMFTMAARTMGYRVIVLDPAATCPAGEVANAHIQAAYDDEAALAELARQCAVISTEFENVPAQSLAFLAQLTQVAPGADCVAIAQDRRREKAFMQEHGIPVGPWAAVESAGDVARAAARIRFPAVLKTARFGYDGKGQIIVREAADLAAAWDSLGQVACVLEEFLNLEREVSIIVARTATGAMQTWPVAENEHVDGILHLSIVPARITEDLARQVREAAARIAERMNYVGVLGVEFFVTREGDVLVNEMAPRPHNSGHYTQDACVTSQFEQQVRAICGVPLGDTRLLSPVVMLNLLGDLWANDEPRWQEVLARPGAKLHLYGKHAARPGRKMAHINCLAADPDEALAAAKGVYAALARDAGLPAD